MRRVLAPPRVPASLWLRPARARSVTAIVFVALALYVTEIGTPTDVGLVLAAHALPLVRSC